MNEKIELVKSIHQLLERDFHAINLFVILMDGFFCLFLVVGWCPPPSYWESPQLPLIRQKLEGLWGARLKGERGLVSPNLHACAVPTPLAPTPCSAEPTDPCGRGDDFAFQHRD